MNLILGQGIAGTVLALTLLRRGKPVVVIDDGHRSASSTVAAGLWNPIVFRRINKSWMADELILSLDEFYRSAEELLQVKFYHPIPLWRIHSSDLENVLWTEKMDDPEFAPYLDRSVHNSAYRFPTFEFETGIVNHAGYLDVDSFLTHSRKYFDSLGIMRIEHFSLPENFLEFQFLEIEGQRPERVIDCTGHLAAAGHLFGYLPFALAKGELLTIKCPGLELRQIFNAGFFLLPLGNDEYRVGATFEWDELDNFPTEKAKSELLVKFQKWVNLPFDIVDHKAGVRPAVQDRRPLIGRHPEVENLYLFNGMGTKGVMLAPLMAHQLAAYIFEGEPLLEEADIVRFSKYFKPEKSV